MSWGSWVGWNSRVLGLLGNAFSLAGLTSHLSDFLGDAIYLLKNVFVDDLAILVDAGLAFFIENRRSLYDLLLIIFNSGLV